jgi:flagellar motility protein MotE (MotC chaperone)
MNKKTIMIGAIVGLLTLSEAGILLLSYKTDFFQKAPAEKKGGTASEVAKKRTTKEQPGQSNQIQHDTVKTGDKGKNIADKKDTADVVGSLTRLVQAKSDSLTLLMAGLATEQKKTKDLSDQLKKFSAKQADLQEQKRKEIQKIYNTMDAENAARIIEKLSDQDIVDILLSVQKRQAAKILASLDPTRAARLTNQVNINN